MLLSLGVVNTNGGALLLACLDAIVATVPGDLEHEVLVVDNASDDGSADAALGRHPRTRVIRRELRVGKAENDSLLLREARGRYCLLLNEDAELRPGAAEALLEALEGDLIAGAAGAQLLSPTLVPQSCAWRLPGLVSALAFATFLQRRLAVQSRGGATRRVGWVQSSAMLVRRSAAADVRGLDPAFFVYSDETDFCKRLGDRGWRTLWVPAARAVHHEQLSSDAAAAARRIVEFHRGRERYMQKHHGAVAAFVVRGLTAWGYGVRALAALLLPGHDAKRLVLHARQALRPWRGEGLREAAERHNLRCQRRPGDPSMLT